MKQKEGRNRVHANALGKQLISKSVEPGVGMFPEHQFFYSQEKFWQ